MDCICRCQQRQDSQGPDRVCDQACSAREVPGRQHHLPLEPLWQVSCYGLLTPNMIFFPHLPLHMLCHLICVARNPDVHHLTQSVCPWLCSCSLTAVHPAGCKSSIGFVFCQPCVSFIAQFDSHMCRWQVCHWRATWRCWSDWTQDHH